MQKGEEQRNKPSKRMLEPGTHRQGSQARELDLEALTDWRQWLVKGGRTGKTCKLGIRLNGRAEVDKITLNENGKRR